MSRSLGVKVYHGYGHTHDLIVYGHVFRKLPAKRKSYTNKILSNVIQLLRLFIVKPMPDVRVRLIWYDQLLESVTEKDGFFKFEWKATHEAMAGWHPVIVESLDVKGRVNGKGKGMVFIPHSTQYGFISDIDDTVMISHSATIGRRLRELFIKNPHTRHVFPDIAKHYELLAASFTTPQAPNPFFYVSSSEWNLYDYLHDFFDHNHLPSGAFLLNQVKRWYQLWKTGKTKHEGKLLRVLRILNTFPKQKFILFGDNTQSDPAIYAKLAERFPVQIYAVYIRNIIPANEGATAGVLEEIKKRGIHTCLFKESKEAIIHSKEIGLI
ncbi:MAG: phosphatase domain-containing protein [Chitinophagaceae bacterium]